MFKYIRPEIPTKKSKVTLQEVTSYPSQSPPTTISKRIVHKNNKNKTALLGLKPAIYTEIPGFAAPKGLQSSM